MTNPITPKVKNRVIQALKNRQGCKPYTCKTHGNIKGDLIALVDLSPRIAIKDKTNPKKWTQLTYYDKFINRVNFTPKKP